MRSHSHETRMHGSYFVVTLIAIAIVAVVFAGLFFFQVFKPIQTNAGGDESLGRSSDLDSNSNLTLLPYHWTSDSDTNTQDPSNLSLLPGAKASTIAATQFLVNHPGASIKLCVRGKAQDKNGYLTVSSLSLNGATIALSDETFETVCVKQTVSPSAGTDVSTDGWNVLRISANDSTLLVRSVSLASTSQ